MTELLAPAGTLKNMRYALAYGADAVYAGQPRYSLRVRNNDFNMENFATGINEAHALGKQFFVASNISPHNRKIDTYLADMEPVIAMGPDALIMADPGLIMMVRERWPEMPVHLSVQANTVNYATVKFWQSVGIKRVILSRELSIEEIAEIRQQCPEMELEVFVHGALCIAYSGRCLLSGYFNHRDPNQGTCTNACRWDYKVSPGVETDTGDIQKAPQNQNDCCSDQQSTLGTRNEAADGLYVIEESTREGEVMPIMEDEHGTYIMNSKDLRAIRHVQKLVEVGVNSFKIEGRTKSYYYAARVSQIYRQAIDDAVAGREFNPELFFALDGLANRGYTEGFYERHPTQDYQNYMQNSSQSSEQQFVGDVVDYDVDSKRATIEVKNRFEVGDTVQLLTPDGNEDVVIHEMWDLYNTPRDAAPGSGHVVKIILDRDPGPKAMIARYLNRDAAEQPQVNIG